MSNLSLAAARKLGLACVLAIFCAANLQAQEPRVNVSSPIDSVSYARSDQNEVFVTVKLRVAKPTDDAALISRFRITSFNVTSDDKRTGRVNNTPMAADSLEYNFVVPISTAPIVTPGAVFRLSPNWKSFSFSCDYEFTPDRSTVTKRSSSPVFTVLRNFIEPETTRNVRSTIELPTLKAGNNVTVPVRLDDDDMVVDIELFDGTNTVASGSDFFERGKRKVVALKPDPRFNITANTPYQVKIKPRFRNEVNLSTKTFDWTPGVAPPSYSIVRASSSNLDDLRIVSNSDPLPFKVQTTGGGTLSIAIEGVAEEIKPTSSPDGIHQFTISSAIIRALPEGSTDFKFKGTSTQGVELAESNQAFKLFKDTQTRLLGITGLKLDTANNAKILQIDFQLSRKINTQVQIDGGVLIPAAPSGGNTSPFTYTAKIDINAANTLNALQTAITRNGGTSTQVKFAIIETKDRDIVEIGGFKLDAFPVPVIAQPKDKDTLLKLISDAQNLLKNNRNDQALAAVKTALGLETVANPGTNEQQIITQVIAELKKDKNESGKTKALSIIGSIGRVALNLFGIPVPLGGAPQL